MNMLSCKETAVLVSRAQDRQLSWGERLAMRLHLLICDACRQFVRQVQFLRKAGGYARDHAPDLHSEIVLPEAARERIAIRIVKKD
jgi:anti-sigma factor ChrR (cupin superfamily)